MINLAHELVLKKVLPHGHVVTLQEMVSVVEPMLAHFWESVATDAGVGSSRKEACHKHQWKHCLTYPSEFCSVSIISRHLLKVIDESFLGSPGDIHCLPKTNCIEGVSESCVSCESIRAYPWSLVNLFSLFLIDQATPDHPPANESLKASKGK
jgi:hypothetical protein